MNGCLGLLARMLGGLILLGWPWALGIGWAAWLIAVPWYAILAAAWYGSTRKDAPEPRGSCGCDEPDACENTGQPDTQWPPRQNYASGHAPKEITR